MNFRKKNSEILQTIPFSRNSVKKLRKNFQKILRKYLIIVENARRKNFADNLDLLVSLFVCRAIFSQLFSYETDVQLDNFC